MKFTPDDLLRFHAADPVDIGQRDQNPLVGRDIHASDTRQGWLLLTQKDNRPKHAAGNPKVGDYRVYDRPVNL